MLNLSGYRYLIQSFKGFSMRKQELHPRTAIVNKKQKNQSRLARNEALLWLAAVFPRAFDNSIMIQPLKLGIMEDILAHADQAVLVGISKSKLRQAVVMYTRRIDYLTCLKAREMRVNLSGEPESIVTEDEANRAAAKIKKRIEKSVKNARKSTLGKPAQSCNAKSNTSDQEDFYSVDDKFNDYLNVNNLAQPSRNATVVIKQKSARSYDPEVVARLKEKLGIARKANMSKEPY